MSATEDLEKLLLARRGILAELVAKPREKRDLIEDIEVARSTLDTIVRDLERAGLVTYSGGRWRGTVLGAAANHIHDRYRSALTDLVPMAELLNVVDPDLAPGAAFLIDATVVRPIGPVPDGVLEVLLDAAEAASRFRLVTPVAIAAYVQPFWDNLTSGTASTGELVVPQELAATLHRLDPELVAAATSNPNVAVRCGPVPDRFGLWIADDTKAGLIVYGDTGVRGIIVNDTKDAVAWANQVIDAVAADAVAHTESC